MHLSPEQATQLLAEVRAVFDKTRSEIQQLHSLSTQSTPPQHQSTPPQPITQKKKKRNEKTRLQYKRRALQVTVQEVEHQEVHSAGVQSSDKASKHVVLKAVARWLACWYAVIQWMTRNGAKDPYGSAEIPRHSIG